MRVTRTDGVFWDVVDGGTVVCHPESGELYRLNATAAFLWNACDDNEVESLTVLMAGAFPDQPVEVLANDTDRFVHDMCEKGLLVVSRGGA